MTRPARLLSLILACSINDGCRCQESVISEVRAPDTGYIATFYESNCGATTSFYSSVSLRDRSTSLDGADVVLAMYHSQSIRLKWMSPTQLVIERRWCANSPPKNLAPLKFKPEWRDVRIQYQAGAPIASSEPECQAARPSSQ
jgi:hypothetical protein